MPGEPIVRPMARDELDLLVGWAADEGWNPGLDDAELFWETDPDGFVAIEQDGEFAGGGSITSYDGQAGFMGLFIVRPDRRGRGLGDRLWHARKRQLQERLRPGAFIGMDGVYEMQAWYAKGGFELSHRDIRYRHVAEPAPDHPSIVTASEVPWADLVAYDAACFGAPRERFLRLWVEQPNGRALAIMDDDRLAGFGVIRRCVEGAKIGPLLADDADKAATLYDALASHVVGEPVYLDVPEANLAAVALAAERGMDEVFGCARMYLGPAPDVSLERIFGVTTFELG